MVGNEQENTEKDEEKINKEDKQEGSERIGVEYFIAIFGVFSTLYYTITIKSDIEIMNGELKYRIDTKFDNKFDKKFDNKIEILDKKFEFKFLSSLN
ncbi:hypothetical protein RhiirA4_538658 [Rhizophagus irregularis]|uniref:Uncharacterized protein n=1 Tax=Rhizophagus irregularis TaxID=588596 RepID=A0A2I1G0Q3_9GLOM|nr:hypothetical protein RhiirA4_538658 [Rhizophagus irregularis]